MSAQWPWWPPTSALPFPFPFPACFWAHQPNSGEMQMTIVNLSPSQAESSRLGQSPCLSAFRSEAMWRSCFLPRARPGSVGNRGPAPQPWLSLTGSRDQTEPWTEMKKQLWVTGMSNPGLARAPALPTRASPRHTGSHLSPGPLQISDKHSTECPWVPGLPVPPPAPFLPPRLPHLQRPRFLPI